MTDKAKQKAEELVDVFFQETELQEEYAGQRCAILCSNIILASFSKKEDKHFWLQVKQHLEEM